MHRITGWLLALLLLLPLPAAAQSPPNLIGQWQGTLNVGRALRTVLRFTRGADGMLAGQFYSIDQPSKPLALTGVAQTGDHVTFTVVQGQGMDLRFRADGQSLQGNYNTNGFSIPITLVRASEGTAWSIPSPPSTDDTTTHKIQMVTVADNVQLEVVDWGGNGRPMIFLAGLGATAHVFDKFAPRFTDRYHVYGITRRGYGVSSKPDATVPENYRADRLGDDVLAVMTALKLDHPVLAGWSIAGEEMNSIATRHPEAVTGLVYLDAAGPNAFYAPGATTSLQVSIPDLRNKLAVLYPNLLASGNEALVDQIIATDLPQLAVDLRAAKEDIVAARKLMTSSPSAPPSQAPIPAAVMAGAEKYGSVKVPVLAICVVQTMATDIPESLKPVVQLTIKQTNDAIDAYQKDNPQAKVVRIADARHDVFASNPDEVGREMDSFLAGLH